MEMKEKELQRKKLEEKMKNIDIDIQKLGKENDDGPFFKELLPEGETAAEYCMVSLLPIKFYDKYITWQSYACLDLSNDNRSKTEQKNSFNQIIKRFQL